MTEFRVEFTRRASRDLKRTPPWLQRRVDELVSMLRKDPVPRVGLDVRELIGMRGVYRVRIGDYRIVYLVNDSIGVVTILRVTSRGDAYAD